MIHLVGIVFSNGTGFVLFNDEIFANETENTLIWGLTQAITSFALVNLKSEGKLELIAGKYRLVFYDPFLGLIQQPEFAYTLVGIQDIYNNMDMCVYKLKKIHDLILTSGLDSNIAFLTFGEYLSSELLESIAEIVNKTAIFPIERLDSVKEIIKNFTIVLEDPNFSESVLNNLIAEAPLDTQTFWLERFSPKTVYYPLNLDSTLENPVKEAFLSFNLEDGKSDYCLLCRIVFFARSRNDLHLKLQDILERLKKEIL
ncbi:MAG: hypothetical protein ACW981_18080 [Candidatus Hodarchaeales archaeon]